MSAKKVSREERENPQRKIPVTVYQTDRDFRTLRKAVMSRDSYRSHMSEGIQVEDKGRGRFELDYHHPDMQYMGVTHMRVVGSQLWEGPGHPGDPVSGTDILDRAKIPYEIHHVEMIQKRLKGDHKVEPVFIR